MIVFRADASLQIGTGHVMRCLTLADELKKNGENCLFVCREHSGHLLEIVRERGHAATGLPSAPELTSSNTEDGIEDGTDHYSWLGSDWTTDVEQTKIAISANTIDWLIVDHYALNARWESAMRNACAHLMVIDDLADRNHDCDLLLDQNYGRVRADYDCLVPANCELLVGPKYALLRPEFAALRDYSRSRRAEPKLEHLLVTMGGVDRTDATSQVLEALKEAGLPDECEITVVMGSHAPWLEKVRNISNAMPWPTDIKVNTSEMAQLMAESDLVIGAAGSTAWECACMGLPSLTVVLASNQLEAAESMEKARITKLIKLGSGLRDILRHALSELALQPNTMSAMSLKAGGLTDGSGAGLVGRALVGPTGI